MSHTHHTDTPPMEDSDDEDRRKRAHFSNVLKTFDSYLPYCLAANNARRRSYYSIPRARQLLLSDLGGNLPRLDLEDQDDKSLKPERGFESRLDEMDDRIRHNADLLAQIVQESRGLLGKEDLDQNGINGEASASSDTPPSADNKDAEQIRSRAHRQEREISGQEVDKIQSTLKQLVRDWSQEGKAQRDLVYKPIVEAILSRFSQVPSEERGNMRILVPGSGLGRLAFDIALQGFSCQGNEFSFYMLLTSHFIFNKTACAEQHVIYPFAHSFSNWRSAADMLKPVRIPDVWPCELPPQADFSMVSGEFYEIYFQPEEEQAWNVVATCCFVDTAEDIDRFLETLNHLLPVGGFWINTGPFLWHCENTGDQKGGADNLSMELTLEELTNLCAKMGFEIEEQKTLLPMTYTDILNGMLAYNYVPELFVCRKVKDVAEAASV